MGKRSETILRDAGYRGDAPTALVALVALACERPSFEWGNYVSPGTPYYSESYRKGAAAYRSDARRVARGLRDVKRAVELAYVARVTNDALQDAARGSRVNLEWRGEATPPCGMTGIVWRASYCAGQYYPTEYRGAIARVIESAARHMVRES